MTVTNFDSGDHGIADKYDIVTSDIAVADIAVPQPGTTTSLHSQSDTRLLIQLCVVSLLLAFKPSEPYLTNYLIDTKHLTEDQVNQSVYPLYTYTYMLAMLPTTLLAAKIGYKSTLLMTCVAREATRMLLIFATSLLSMQCMQVTFGIAQVDTVLFPTYIYYIFAHDPSAYTRAVAMYYSSNLVGHAAAGITAQLLLTYTSTSYTTLQYISTASVSIGFVLLLILLPNDRTPSPPTHLRMTNAVVTQITVQPVNDELSFTTLRSKPLEILRWCLSKYTSPDILMWSVCFWLTYGINDMVYGYSLSLYYEVDSNAEQAKWQGVSDVMSRLLAAAAAILPAYVGTQLHGSALVNASVWCTITSLACGLILTVSSSTNNIIHAYMYVAAYVSVSAFVLTLTTSHVSRHVTVLQFSALYTVNMFVATVVESVLLYIASDSALALTARQMFVMCSYQLFAVACVCGLATACQWFRLRNYTTSEQREKAFLTADD